MNKQKILTTIFNKLAKAEQRKADLDGKHRTKIAELENKYLNATAPLDEEISQLRTELTNYANENRTELTDNGKTKSLKISSGCLKWTKSRAKVEITGDTAAIIAGLKRRKLNRFIRIREELDKTAILKEHTAIKTPIDGLTIIQSGNSEILTIETGV